MNPSPAKGKPRRKPCTEKPSARFDEEREVVKISLLLYACLEARERKNSKKDTKNEFNGTVSTGV